MSQTAAELAKAVRELVDFVRDRPAEKVSLDDSQRDELTRLDARVEALRIKSGLPEIVAPPRPKVQTWGVFDNEFASPGVFGYMQIPVYLAVAGTYDDGALRLSPSKQWFDRMRSLEMLASECASVPDLDADEQAIVELIIEVGRRLTTAELLDEFSRRGELKAESTTKGKLSNLTKRGILNNRHDTSTKGYGLPEWN
jgi:hypothetical protein